MQVLHQLMPFGSIKLFSNKHWKIYLQSGDVLLKSYKQQGKIGTWIPLARYIAAKALGRSLERHEEVSYLDGDSMNCTIDNLSLSMRVPFDNLINSFNRSAYVNLERKSTDAVIIPLAKVVKDVIELIDSKSSIK